MTEKTVDAETRRSLHPRYWPTWLGLGVLWFITRLPYRWAMAVGDGIGLVAYRVSRYRRHIVEINLQLCFPELSDRDRQQLARRNFMYTGRGLVELGLAAWLPESRIRGLATVEGGEHVERAVSQGRGVILLGGHFTALDMLGRALLTRVRFQVIFRENRNPVIERFMAGSRRRDFDEALNRRDMRGLVRALRAGRVVWYPPDQDYGRRYSVFAPLFGVPASTITVPARLARMSDAAVIPIRTHALEDGSGYRVQIDPPLEGFPSGDDEADAARVNRLMEERIREHPAQYYWVHRRFKTRPPGEPKPYTRERRKRKRRRQ